MSSADEFYDGLETRDPAQREEQLMAALSAQLSHAKDKAPHYADVFADLDTKAINSRAALATLPVTRKSDLAALQKKTPPLGGINTVPLSELSHIFASPGGLYEPDADRKDYWRYARALWAAGVRPGHVVHNTFSYHLTPAAMLVESGCKAIGCPVIPGGVGNTEIQIQLAADLKPDFFIGTPSFLRIILNKARELGHDLSNLKHGLVGAEALPPSLRQELADLGVDVLQGYGTADLGSVAYESKAIEGMIIDEGVIVEIVEPGSGTPVAEGEVGEIVVTTLNPTYPLIRFATGDLSAVLPGASPCGRTNMRIRGWMGRADQSTKFKGMFVHPSAIMQIAGRHPEITKARMVITSENNNDAMTLKFAASNANDDLAAAVEASIQAVLKLRGSAELVDAASLPDDGLMIEDARSYE
ncbi:MAG: AMP-binding protein [Rhodospirillaceae bacterium]|jgi:phenylacetate-CoA ligase|nr:AMP-binding protein [Rhodospirillaceae bacterium]MBT4691403.1 AMP-binding protein [Rhodospirillaceae bacterium]MBT5081459.1 AMP-binding protein [Rhodospirillaceae bacterium]MBT5522943.1 AMP-binding protein [Rhodospirillaceae bacterium]MBT5880822.1 AMP-binding protein [Rhodospirillaceae bacterium]